MKTKTHLQLALSIILMSSALLLSGCLEDKCETSRTYQVFEPVYVQPDEFRGPVITEGPRELRSPGKIYVYQNYLLIGESQEGIHVIDNSNPENPVNLNFIEIPGNTDMAVRGDLLYANNYVDLVTINIENPQSPEFAGRTEEVFPVDNFDPAMGYLVDYKQTEETVVVPCDDPNWGRPFWIAGNREVMIDVAFDFASAGSGAVPGIGIGGSMARFTLASDHLYVVDNNSLRVFDLTDAIHPNLANTVNIGWGIETIFPYEENLFIGSQTGMFIFDNSDPLNPNRLAVFQHAQACDPVFVSGNLAYVTLRDGTECQNFNNQLDVVDISDLTNPRLLKTHPMHNPHGLSVADPYLFICEGDEGLKVFDATDWNTIGERLLDQVKGMHTYDVITLQSVKLAIVVGADGLYQFDFTNPENLRELSVIPVD